MFEFSQLFYAIGWFSAGGLCFWVAPAGKRHLHLGLLKMPLFSRSRCSTALRLKEEIKKNYILWAIKGLYQHVQEQAVTPPGSAAPGENHTFQARLLLSIKGSSEEDTYTSAFYD